MSACPACGKDNPEGFRFCGYCSAPLAGVTAARAAEERKIVSVLFCDVVGFTSASEGADPEDVRARMQPYYIRLRREIEAFGGTVEKFIGDAVMAVFGVPVAHEDDAERAVRAGLRILDAIADLNDADPSLRLSVRVGINTGEVVVSLGAATEGEAAVLGDAVNTAARIQTAAPIDGIAVGEGTFRATERVFEYEPLEPVSVKGKAAPLGLWRALAARARFGSDVIRSMTTPLVGRETDLLLLRGTFEKSRRERSVQLVTVVGEPGLGKSRLVAELFAYVDELTDLIRWRQGRCLPYGDGITFWALGEILKAHAGIYESDPLDEAARKLDLVLPEGEDGPWLRARLLPLLGIDSGEAATQEEAFTAWRRLFESIAERDPTVLVFEDLHWADEALLAFLEHLADWAHGVPLLVVCTTRPELYESHPSWGAGLRNATTISLSPLTETETAHLIAALLDQAVLPAETQLLILDRAGGNPLYAEEFVRMLRDRELLDPRGTLRTDAEVPFPDSIQALIAARLDTLAADRKSLLQDAAVIGKVFWAGALCAMGDRQPSDVDGALHELARKELVRPSRQSSMERERELGFWHILIRDVAYAQIPRAERARKHVLAASWLEDKAGDRVEDLAEVLAFHTGEAIELATATGDHDMAATLAPWARRYALLAGERAVGLDTGKALRLFERALHLTQADDPEYAVAQARWGDAAYQAGMGREAAEALTQAVATFRSRGEVRAAAETLTTLSLVRQLMGDHEGCAACAEQAVALAETEPPGRVLVEALGKLAALQWVEARHQEAITTADRALQLGRELDVSAPNALAYRGLARCDLGDTGGLFDMEQALDTMIAEGKGREAGQLQSNLGYTRWAYEGPIAAVEAFVEAEAFSARRGLVTTSQVAGCSSVGALVEAGRLDEAIVRAGELLPVLEASANVFSHVEASAVYARARAEQERDPEAAQVAEAAVVAARKMKRSDEFCTAAVAAALSRIQVKRLDDTRALLSEVVELPNIQSSGEYGPRLPALVRCALQTGDAELAARFVEGVEPTLPVREHALVAAVALLAEARGEHAEAAERFADAASRWDVFGARLEQAYALLGQGRCLAALADSAADVPLRQARALFAEMGARLRVDECDTLLARASALSS